MTRKRPRIYVAGPYTAEGDWKRKQNIEVAGVFARQLWKLGASVLCPHLNTRDMDGPDISWQDFLDGDFEWIAVSDAIFMLPNWQDSKGATAEYDFANSLNIPVLYTFPEARHFIRSTTFGKE